MTNAITQPHVEMLFGIPALDRFVDISHGIITIRCTNHDFLFWLASRMMVLHAAPEHPILYLHFMDYHKRYWSVKLDQLIQLAKQYQRDSLEVLNSVFCVRAFMKDQIEAQENWGTIMGLNTVRGVIVDSISELFADAKDPARKLFVLGKLNSLSTQRHCVCIVLDASPEPLDSFLGEISSIVLEGRLTPAGISLNLVKHPCLKEQSLDVAL